MNLDKYIADLLLEHDFVIVPDFGAFVSSYHPAEVNSSLNVISSPSKRVAFNPSLTTNDAMLVHYISKTDKITYQQATDFIKLVVNKWNEELASNEIIRLNKIGELKRDENGKLNFSQYNSFNFLIDSFGFRSVKLKKLQRSSFIPEFENIIEKANSTNKHANVYLKHKQNSKILVYSLAGYLPLLIGLWIVFMIKEPFIEYNQSSLSPISFNEQELSQIQKIIPEQKLAPANKEAQIAENNKIEVPKIETISIKPEFYYFIIGGCFHDKINAQTFQTQLKTKDFNGSEVLELKGGYYRVSYNKFVTENDANKFLTIIKEKENSLAWILKQ